MKNQKINATGKSPILRGKGRQGTKLRRARFTAGEGSTSPRTRLHRQNHLRRNVQALSRKDLFFNQRIWRQGLAQSQWRGWFSVVPQLGGQRDGVVTVHWHARFIDEIRTAMPVLLACNSSGSDKLEDWDMWDWEHHAVTEPCHLIERSQCTRYNTGPKHPPPYPHMRDIPSHFGQRGRIRLPPVTDLGENDHATGIAGMYVHTEYSNLVR